MIKKSKKEIVKELPSPKMKSPIQWFFELGDKITGGDPLKAQDFQYYMLSILFLSFAGMFILNLYRCIISLNPSNLIWALIGFAITSLQYFNLKNFYQMRKMRESMPEIKSKEEHNIEDVEDMLKGFNKKNDKNN